MIALFTLYTGTKGDTLHTHAHAYTVQAGEWTDFIVWEQVNKNFFSLSVS